MLTLGDKIKKIRISNNLTQSELAEMLFVSEKTISSWENNRTVPDLNMIYKISDYFKKSFYCLINDDYDTENTNEIEIKLKVDKDEYSRILNIIKKYSINKGNVNQIDTYYTLIDKEFNQEWLRVRNENGKYIFNYNLSQKKRGAKTSLFPNNLFQSALRHPQSHGIKYRQITLVSTKRINPIAEMIKAIPTIMRPIGHAVNNVTIPVINNTTDTIKRTTPAIANPTKEHAAVAIIPRMEIIIGNQRGDNSTNRVIVSANVPSDIFFFPAVAFAFCVPEAFPYADCAPFAAPPV